MKHVFKTFTSVLLGAVAIVGCQRELIEPNPDYNAETNEVKAKFVLSVSTGGSSTKMGAEAVQRANNFRGMEDAKLILFATNTTDAYVKPGTTFKQVYNFGRLFTAGQITAANNDDASSNRVVQLTIPLGCDAALFYGRAINPTPGKSTGKTGSFTIDDDSPSGTDFAISRRIGDAASDLNSYDATARLMIYAINTIIKSSVPAQEGSAYGYDHFDALSWRDLGVQYEINNDLYEYAGTTGDEQKASISVLGESLGKAYSQFTYIKDGEYRAGSSGAVKKMMQDLYSVVSSTVSATPSSKDEANVKRLATEIETRMNVFFTNGWAYKEPETIKTAIVTASPEEGSYKMNSATWTAQFTGARDLNDYPYGDFNVPVGAAQLNFDRTTSYEFSYKHPNDALVTPGATFDPRKYVYAPELWYYVNSPLLVTTKADLQTSDFPNGVSNWNRALNDDGGKWKAGNWKQDKVESETRGVAVRYNIHYGVALLETNVAFATGITNIKDNRKAMTNNQEEDRDITISNSLFTLRGVLIGGVHPRYGWQFLPRPRTQAEIDAGVLGDFDGVIYDDDIPSAAIPTATPNYTLVYDNYNWKNGGDADDQNEVYIALELVNNGDAFWGRDNMIPHDGIFYLGAKLALNPKNLAGNTSENQSITWPTTYEVPPIDEDTGLSKQIPRIFIQDFLTKATFRIGAESLHYAYLSIPDLRSSQLSLGLSVDLSWKQGYEYDIVFGNNPAPGN